METNLRNILFNKITAIVVIIVIAIISWFVTKKLDSWSGGDLEEKYISVVITNKSDATFTIPKEFREGFGDEPPFKSVNSEQIIKFKKMDDLLSTEQAEIIAKKILADENCVLIIGNSTSSLTEVTLNTILSSQSSKPGFLLPIATADNLIEMAKDQKYTAILRMMPNNEHQARTIKNFIYKQFSRSSQTLIKIAIYADEENTAYSHNLSQKIADKIILNEEENQRGVIVLKKDYGNSNRLINDYYFLKEYNQLPDVIVFVGISSNGSLLMEELKNLNISIPVIYTDGCTVNNLMEKSKDNPNNYFISAVDIKRSENKSPTYYPVGADARNLAKLIINNIPGNITRESVSQYIDKIRNENTKMMDNGEAGNYQFNNSGDNTLMNWKVYSYIKGELRVVYNEN